MGKHGGISTGERHASICILENFFWKDGRERQETKEARNEAVAVIQVRGDTQTGQWTVELKRRKNMRGMEIDWMWQKSQELPAAEGWGWRRNGTLH